MAELEPEHPDLFPIMPTGQRLLGSFPADAIRFDGLTRYVRDGSVQVTGPSGSIARVVIANRQMIALHATDATGLLAAEPALPALWALLSDPRSKVSAARIDRDLLLPLPFIWETAATYGPVPVAWFAGGIDAVLADIGTRGVCAAVMLTAASGTPSMALYKGSVRIFPADPAADPIREQLAALATAPPEARQTSQLSVWELPADWTPTPLVALTDTPESLSPPSAAATMPIAATARPITPAPAATAAPAAHSTVSPESTAARRAAPAATSTNSPTAPAESADVSGLPLTLIAAAVEADIQSYLERTGATGFAPRVQSVADDGWTCGEFFATFEKTEDIPTLDAASRATLLSNWRALATTQMAAQATT